MLFWCLYNALIMVTDGKVCVDFDKNKFQILEFHLNYATFNC